MRGVSGPISRKPAARMEQGLPLLLHCAEQLHVHVPPDSCAIEIESTPSAVGTLVGTAVGPATHMDYVFSLPSAAHRHGFKLPACHAHTRTRTHTGRHARTYTSIVCALLYGETIHACARIISRKTFWPSA
jgi:hypothetical protein